MLKGSAKVGLLLALVSSAAGALACSSPPAARAPAAIRAKPAPVAPPAPPPAAAATVPTASAPAVPAVSSGFAEGLAALRPTGTEQALQGLVNTPADPEAYAKAALAYAATDVPGMTLLWGMGYQAMGGGPSDAAVAAAFAKVLTERIQATRDAHEHVTFHVRLAPGQMPTRQDASRRCSARPSPAFVRRGPSSNFTTCSAPGPQS
jgi:hypothetical protein